MPELTFRSAEEIRHAYILSSPSTDAAVQAAMRIAGAAVCRGSAPLPCGRCPACRKAEAGVHPDIQVISRPENEKGQKKREMTVDQIRTVSSDAAILPNEAPRKVYIFLEAETMNTEAQNAALKLLEEPPNGAVLLLCTSNAVRLLSTVRSRCVEINIPADSAENSENLQALVNAYLKTVASGSRFALWKFCEDNNGLSIQEMTDFCLSAIQEITDMLCARHDSLGMSRELLFSTEQLLETCVRYLSVNVNVKQVFSLLETGPMPNKAK